jgi:hypothetical protein
MDIYVVKMKNKLKNVKQITEQMTEFYYSIEVTSDFDKFIIVLLIFSI